MNNKRMKKFLPMLFSIILIFTNVSFASDNHNMNTKYHQEYHAKTFENLDIQGKNITDKLEDNTKLIFDSFKIELSEVDLSGYVELNKIKNKPFNIKGVLKKSKENNNVIVAEVKDTFNNYEVIHLGIDKNAKDNIIIDRRKFNKNNSSNKVVFKLYLLEKGTRNFITLEIINPKFLKSDELFTKFNELDTIDHIDEYWYAKIIQPISEEGFEVRSGLRPISGDIADNYKIKENIEPVEMNSIYTTSSTGQMVAHQSDYCYRFTYEVGGGLIYEDFVVRRLVYGPDIMPTQGFYYSMIKVLDEETWSATVPGVNSTDTNTRLGYISPTRIDGGTAEYLSISRISWDQNMYDDWSVNMKVGWFLGTSLGVFGVSGTIQYDNTDYISNGNSKLIDPLGDKKGKAAGTEWQAGHYLADVGNTFETTFDLGKWDGQSGDKTQLETKFTYDIFNGLDYTWGGQKTHIITFPIELE